MNNQKLTTGTGIAMYPYLFSPDTKFSTEGVYCMNLRMDLDEGTKLKDQLEKILADYVQSIAATTGKKPSKMNAIPIKHTSDMNNEPCIDFKFKLKPAFKSKSGETVAQRPAVFDASLKPLTEECKLGNGSKVKVNFTVIPYNTAFGCGISLRLQAVQVIDLVQYSSDNDTAGFTVEEGFVSAESESAPAAATNTQAAPRELVADASSF